MSYVMMSIKPGYADLIFSGIKAVELRRTAVNIKPGDIVFVYASAPVKAVIGKFQVDRVRMDGLSEIWAAVNPYAAVSKEEFDCYFEGARWATAIYIGSYVTLTPVPLDVLRRRVPGFRPPQSYMFWRHGVASLDEQEPSARRM